MISRINTSSLDIGSVLGIERLGDEQDSYLKRITDLTETNNQLLRKNDEACGEVAYWERECNSSKSCILFSNRNNFLKFFLN